MGFSIYSINASVDGASQTLTLNFDGNDLANILGEVLTYDLVLNPATEPGDTATGPFNALVIPTNNTDGTVSGFGYNAIVVGTTAKAVTLAGGGASGGQVVLASDAGLDFTSNDSTNTTVVAGGGDNDINLSGSSGTDAVYLAAGSNTIVAGKNATTIAAGIGTNVIYGGKGATNIVTEGMDTIHLGTGASAVFVGPVAGEANVASAVVYADTTIGGQSSVYLQTVGASTLFGGTSRYDTVFAAPGGYYYGGSGGDNILVAEGSSVTLVGGGNNDYLQGNGYGSDSIVAGDGNNITIVATANDDTLVGGSGNVIFDVTPAIAFPNSVQTDTINLGSGNATVNGGGVYVNAGAGSLLFNGSGAGNPSTNEVVGGTGSLTVYAGYYGGAFTGGSGGSTNVLIGDNLPLYKIVTGEGNGNSPRPVEFTAAGSYSYLQGSTVDGNVLSGGTATDATIVSEASDDTVVGGTGNDTIDMLGGGGIVGLNLAIGAATVQVASESIVVGGAGTLYFVGGSSASTVQGGSGTETIFGGAGGGYFSATSTGANVLIGTSGATTLVGASGSYIQGNYTGSTADLLQATSGNETLTAGNGADTLVGSTSGIDVFSFTHEANQTYTITNFHNGDSLYMLNETGVAAALISQTPTVVSGSLSTEFALSSGTKVILSGFNGILTSNQFGSLT